MTTDQIVLELRALPGAPEALRTRVRVMPEPRARREWQLPAIQPRRFLLVVAPAAVALALGAAAVHGVVSSGGGPSTQAEARQTADEGGSAPKLRSAAGGASSAGSSTVPVFDAATTPQATHALTRAAPFATGAIPPSATRLNRYEAWLRVEVARDKLAAVTTQAMRVARRYGGYVTSADLNTPGRRGQSSLVLRVQLRVTVARLEQKLQSPSLSAEDRVRLQYELEQAKQALASTTSAHQKTQREGTLATISVAFSAKRAAVAAPAHKGRLGRTLGDAAGFLVAELAWLLYALIVVAPFALVAALVAYGVRAARRSSDRRLLEST